MDERQRLTDLYYEKTDEELLEIAADLASLTDAAQQAVAAEVRRRKLKLPEVVVPAENEPSELVTIRQFRDLPEAVLAQGVLDSAEIDSLLADEHIVRMDWFISNLVGGVKLQVKREDVDAALQLLDTPAAEELTEQDEP